MVLADSLTLMWSFKNPFSNCEKFGPNNWFLKSIERKFKRTHTIELTIVNWNRLGNVHQHAQMCKIFSIKMVKNQNKNVHSTTAGAGHTTMQIVLHHSSLLDLYNKREYYDRQWHALQWVEAQNCALKTFLLQSTTAWK